MHRLSPLRVLPSWPPRRPLPRRSSRPLLCGHDVTFAPLSFLAAGCCRASSVNLFARGAAMGRELVIDSPPSPG